MSQELPEKTETGSVVAWQALAFTGRSDPNILRAFQEAALPQNVDGQDAEGGTN